MGLNTVLILVVLDAVFMMVTMVAAVKVDDTSSSDHVYKRGALIWSSRVQFA